jgi:hypothetical protein
VTFTPVDLVGFLSLWNLWPSRSIEQEKKERQVENASLREMFFSEWKIVEPEWRNRL